MLKLANIVLSAAAATVVIGQEIGFTDGPSFVNGPSAISNPNINNGWQADSSLFSSGNGGAAVNTFNDVVGTTFTNINTNTAFKDNIVNNPSKTVVSGDKGWTANGDSNNLGPVENDFGSTAGFARRSGDVVFADNHHQVAVSQVPHVVTFPATHVIRPVVSAAGYGPGAALAKRTGDIVFADNHHQVDAVVGFAPQSVPVVFSVPVAQPFVASVGFAAPAHFVQPVVEQAAAVAAPVFETPSENKAAIIQNKA
ncbi:hypothetical protein LPJ73_005228 [Coemansia sp. RSA 2703]|nr:hypothetical protein LPJ73_005228 [Coemansia sp. RSA 2703]KAJ2368107.1 hypothetical protein IW150_005495 [Coemansia sp. RSA 2607]KAJ2388104.1 hypothetical protein GGI05_003884 [Coemansia sp. RSA 2603]